MSGGELVIKKLDRRMAGYKDGFTHRMEWTGYSKGFSSSFSKWRKERENFARCCNYLRDRMGPSAELGMAKAVVLGLDKDPEWAWESENRHCIYLKESALTLILLQQDRWNQPPRVL